MIENCAASAAGAVGAVGAVSAVGVEHRLLGTD